MISSVLRGAASQVLLQQGSRAIATQAMLAAGQKVGWVGLGRMGSRMVKQLLEAGNSVVVYDSNQLAVMRAKDVAKEHDWGSRFEVRDCPADLAADTDIPVVLTMLSNATACKDVYLGGKGLFKVPGGPRSSIFVDCTTVDPSTTRQLAAAAGMLRLHDSAAFLTDYGLRDGKPHLLDAPVSGGVVAAEHGDLTFMIGGHPRATDAVTPLLKQMGKDVIYCGKHGAGLIARLCNTLVVAASMAAVSESLAVGKRLGVDSKVLTEVLNSGSARCWASEVYNPVPGVIDDRSLPSNNGYKPGLPASTINEHLGMLLDAAQTAKSPAPLARNVMDLYDKINSEGLGDKDFSSIYRYIYGAGCSNSEWKEGQQLFSSQVP